MTFRETIRNSEEVVWRVSLVTLFAWISFFSTYPGWLTVDSKGWTPIVWLLLALGLATLLTEIAASPSPGLFLRRLGWPEAALVLVLLGLLSGTLTESNAQNRELAWRVYGHLVLVLAVGFWLGRAWRASPDRWRTVVLTITWMSGLVALYGILEWVFRVNPVYEHLWSNPFYERYLRAHRPLSTQFNPAPLGSYLALSLPFAVYAARSGRGLARTFARVVVALDLGCIYLALSRGPLLVVALMGLLLLVLRARFLHVLGGCLTLLVLSTAAVWLPGHASRLSFETMFFGSTGVISPYRLDRLRMTWEMFTDHPLHGAGFYQFSLQFLDYYPHGHTGRFRIADNMVLTLLAETGLVGTLTFGIFAGGMIWCAYRAWRRSRGTEQGGSALTLFLVMVGALASLGHYELLYISGPAAFFGLICGLAAGAPPGRACRPV